MNLFEAKQLLKNHGCKLIKEAQDEKLAVKDNYICYSVYGDRAHSNPETAYIYMVSPDKNKIIDTIVDWFSAGADDIWYCGVIKAGLVTARAFQRMGNKDIADTPQCETLLRHLPNAVLEYSGEDGLEFYDPDDKEGSIERIREKVTNDVMAL